ncbi:hypothetical protein ABEB36_009561 [Hypothenemus hampei]|uniref:Uncharacterized protein n=1 Tax=Hypothenemus hampei TaxID=57062 RepID=A0ABD1EKU3_HYPHA
MVKEKIRQLKENISEIFDDSNPKENLRYCIKYHQAILQGYLGHMSFMSAVVLSYLLANTIKNPDYGYIFDFAGYIFTQFVLCYAGQVIYDETIDIKNAIWKSNWHRDLTLAKDLQIVMMRSQKAMFLEGFLGGSFNFETWILILKTAYTYTTLLNSQ